MVHPDLPDTVIHPKESKADAYLAGGWMLRSEAEQAAEAATPTGHDETAPESEPVQTQSEPKKRRSAASKTEEEAS